MEDRISDYWAENAVEKKKAMESNRNVEALLEYQKVLHKGH